MAGGKGNYLKQKVLDHVLGGADYARAATVYIALFISSPSSSGGGTEVSGGGYARQAVTNDATNWPGATTGGVKNNGTIIDFGTATANWGTVTAGAIYDASTGGNLLYFGPLTVSKTINTDDGFKIPANGITLTET